MTTVEDFKATYPFQQRAVDNTLFTIDKTSRLLLVSPCGSGKSVMIAQIAISLAENGKRVLVLAHRREIINQLFAVLTHKLKIDPNDVNVILSQHSRDNDNPRARIHLAGKDTIGRRTLPEADVVIVDECHRVLARQYKKLIDRYAKAIHIGFTATPFRMDGQGLGAYYQVLIEAAKPSELIKSGYLAEPRIFTTSDAFLPNLEGVPVRLGDYVVSELKKRVLPTELVGDVVRHKMERAPGLTTVVFAVDIEHSKALRDRFRGAGVRAEHIDGTLPIVEREEVQAKVARGDVEVLCNCMVLSEGWDLPSCRVVVLARPTHSLALYLQQAGRGMRVFPGARPYLLDHAGSVPKFFFPHADRQFVLSETKVAGGLGAPPVKKCPTCMAIISAGYKTCPECGHEFAHVEAEKTPILESKEKLIEIHLQTLRERVLGLALARKFPDPEQWVAKVMDKYTSLSVEI